MTDEIITPDQFEECLCFRLRQANRVMTQIYDRHLMPCDIKVTQFSILRIVDLVNETTNKGLQDILVIDQSTLSRNLKPLLRDGYIQTKPGEDRREKLLSLTETGKNLLIDASDYWSSAQIEMREKLGSIVTGQLFDLSKNIVALKSA